MGRGAEKREDDRVADEHVSTPELGQERGVASSFHTLFPRKSEILDGLRSQLPDAWLWGELCRLAPLPRRWAQARLASGKLQGF